MKNTKEVIWPNHRIQKYMDHQIQNEYLRDEESIDESPRQKSYRPNFDSEIVRQKVASLPTGELAVVYLTFWEGLCEYEISKALCISTIAVKKILSSALERLKNDFNSHQASACA